jgi:DHA2 family multidrug resistance protein
MSDTPDPIDLSTPENRIKRWLVLAAVTYPASLYVGAQTIANAVLPQMQGDLSAGIDQISWVITAAVVASALGIPPAGWLTNRYGRRRVLVVSILGFAISSLLCGLAENLASVVVFRILQSLIAAPVVAVSQAILIDIFPEEERGAAFAFWSAGVLVGWVMAPSLGAYIAELQNWRVIFFVLVPFSLIGVITSMAAPETIKLKSEPFDWFGFASLSAALSCSLIVLNRGQREDWFESNEIILLTVVGTAALYYFVIHSWNAKHPFIHWRIFQDRNYSLGIFITFIYAGMTLVPLVMIPNMMAELKGLELLTTAIILIPRGLAQIFGLIFIGWLIQRFDPRLLTLAGFGLYALGGWPMVNFNMDIGLWDVVWPNIVQGLAMSSMLVPVSTLMYLDLPKELRIDGAAVMQLAYSLSGSIGVAVAVIILSRTTQITQAELSNHVVPGNELLRFPQYHSIDFGSLQSMLSVKSELASQALMVGYANVYWATFILAAVVAPVALAFKVRPTRR